MNTIKMLNNINCDIVIVTKHQSIDAINFYYKNGYKVFGENKIQELLSKVSHFKDAKWHFIGRIQSNKIKLIVKHCDLIHSVSSIKHLSIINKEASLINKTQNILIQLNISNEDTKSGIAITQLDSFVDSCATFKNIQLLGIMVMGDRTNNHLQIDQTFFIANTIKEKYNFKVLSMGMSSDYQIALKNNSTMIRLGSILFN